MSQVNESPIITVERRKAVTIIISAVIIALALGVGLTKVGTGFATRAGMELLSQDLPRQVQLQIMQSGLSLSAFPHQQSVLR